MKRQFHALLAVWTSIAIAVTGCAPTQPFFFFEDGDLSHYVGMATTIDHPDVDTCSLAEVENAGEPFTVSNPKYREIWELSLQDSVRFALDNSKVMRSLGGRQASFGGQRPQQDESPEVVLRAPQQTPTVYDPAIVESDPNFGVEGALSAFDAQLASQLLWQKNDRPSNINLARVPQDIGFDRVRTQDLGQFSATLSKRLPTGGRVAVAANTTYDRNSSSSRETPQDWLQNFELQASHPLLQGGGLFFNRIAGPFDPFNGTGTSSFDGVLLNRIRTDISLAEFEAGVRNLVNDVEFAYWNLYFAYRNLEARKVGRDSALATWRKVYALYLEGARGGEADKEAQAREQYFFFRAEVETAESDLFRAESRLRYIMGLGATDGRLIAPVTEPTTARVRFDWHEIHAESIARSVELRQQRWRIKQRELELMAAKNLLLPRLDVVSRYRWLGLGEKLLNSDGRPYTASNTDSIIGTDAFSSLSDGNFQESEVGLQFNMPLGSRQALSTVRNEQLQVARERSVLQDQELELSHALTEAVRVLDTSYALMQSNFNRAVAAQRQVEALKGAFDAGTVTVDLVLDAQRRLSEALSAGYRAQADYNHNIAQVHFRKGSLLEFNGVFLAEGPWPGKAYFDAHKRARARDAAYFLNYGFTRPDVVSRGPITPQQADGMMHDGVPSDGMPVPAESQPTPAGPPDSTPEELPSPGPVSMKALGNEISISQSGRSAARAAHYQSEQSASDRRAGPAFDWKLDGAETPHKEKSVVKQAAHFETEKQPVTTLRLSAGGADDDVSSRDTDDRQPVKSGNAPSGWKSTRK